MLFELLALAFAFVLRLLPRLALLELDFVNGGGGGRSIGETRGGTEEPPKPSLRVSAVAEASGNSDAFEADRFRFVLDLMSQKGNQTRMIMN